jgi:hypothetical protein
MNTRRTGSGLNLTKAFTWRTALLVLALGTALPPLVSSSAVAKRDGRSITDGAPPRTTLKVLSTEFAPKSGVSANEALQAFADRLSREGIAEQPDFGSVVLAVETAPLPPDVRAAAVRAVVHRQAAELSGYCFRKRDKRIGERYEPLYKVPNESGSRFQLRQFLEGESILLVIRLRAAPGELPRTDDQLRDLVTLEVVP